MSTAAGDASRSARAAYLAVEVATVMLVAFALSLAAMSAWAHGASVANPRLGLTLTEDCGAGVAVYRDSTGAVWMWRGGLNPVLAGSGCPG